MTNERCCVNDPLDQIKLCICHFSNKKLPNAFMVLVKLDYSPKGNNENTEKKKNSDEQ